MELMHTEVIDGITYKLYAEPDGTPVIGNALASGDAAVDKAAELGILTRLNNGDVWAWANVNVEASVEIAGETFRGDDWLGCCSYRDTADFITPGDYYSDMRDVALDALLTTLRDADKRADAIRAFLQAREPVTA